MAHTWIYIMSDSFFSETFFCEGVISLDLDVCGNFSRTVFLGISSVFFL
jgi:hypothetical protein